MKTTGLFTIHEYHIPFQNYDEPVYIIPFGDIHRSSPMCHVEKWLDFCSWARKKPRTFYLGMGDYDDLISTSEREGLRGARLHDSTLQTIEDTYRKYIDRLLKEIEFMKNRTIGLLEGNHYAVFQNGVTSTQRMCEALNTKYLGCSAFIRVVFYKNNRHTTTNAVDIWAHHGLGAARLVGGSLNRVQQLAELSDAQVLLMGHDHKKSVATITRLKLASGRGGLRLSHRKVVMARTGSFLKGYQPNCVSYVADSGYGPTDLGTIKLEFTIRRSRAGGPDVTEVDIHASI